jgi:hypothetical protein
MQPWFIATEKFSAHWGDAWWKYIEWSGLRQLDELVSLDPMLCPTLFKTIKEEYWPHIVYEDYALDYFVDLDFLLDQLRLANASDYNLLRVVRNPCNDPTPDGGSIVFEFLGYDLVDISGSASALTNCGGFPLAFASDELSSKGLLTNLARALQVQANLRASYPTEDHANCHLWSISRAIAL